MHRVTAAQTFVSISISISNSSYSYSCSYSCNYSCRKSNSSIRISISSTRPSLGHHVVTWLSMTQTRQLRRQQRQQPIGCNKFYGPRSASFDSLGSNTLPHGWTCAHTHAVVGNIEGEDKQMGKKKREQ